MSTLSPSLTATSPAPDAAAAQASAPLRLFPHFFFRTTALPFDCLERLGCPRSVALAERLVADLERRKALAEAFVSRVRAHVAAGDVTPALSQAAQRVRRGRPLHADKLEAVRRAGHAEEAARLEEYDALARRIESGVAEGEALLAQERTRARAELREQVHDPRVREAVLLSSPGALEGVERFCAAPGERHELGRRALRYLQRLCSKNDTISFFGPMTWGRFDAAAPAGLDLRWSGPGLTSRHVFYEQWTADRLARAMERDPRLRGGLVFRVRYPFEWSGTEGLMLHHVLAGRTRRPQPPACDALLRALAEDGLAESALRRAAAALGVGAAEAVQALDKLLDQGVVEAFAVPIEALHPVEDLLATLREAAPAGPARELWERRLGELSELKERFTRAAFEERRVLLREIEGRFAEWTGGDARRNGGQTYGGRNLFYEDCTRRPERFVIGGRVQAEMESDLRSLLAVHSALMEVIEPYGWRRLEEIHATLGRGGRAVPLNKFLIKLAGLVGTSYLDARLVAKEDQEALVEKARGALEMRREGRTRLHVAARDPEAAARAGILRRPVIPGVDLMIAARDTEALERGDYRFVVGEIQYFPLGYPEYLSVFHPDPQAFHADYRRVLAEPRRDRLPLVRVELEEEVTRLVRIREPLADYVLVDGHGRSFDARRPQRRITELSVHLEDGRIVVEDPLGERFLLGNPHHDLFLDAAFKLLAELHRRELGAECDAGGAELVVGERTVVLRRNWRLASEALWGGAREAQAGGGDVWARAPFAAFLAVQRARRRHGLPRHAFARVPGEVKPVLVDFDNPMLVENLMRMAPAGKTLALSEMRPGPGELWLASPEGRHTSELRILLG
jgi:hypothetical protein